MYLIVLYYVHSHWQRAKVNTYLSDTETMGFPLALLPSTRRSDRNSRIMGVFGGNLPFCQKLHGLVDKIKSLSNLFPAEHPTCAISTRLILSTLSQNLPVFSILVNFPFSTTTHVLLSFNMTYTLGVPAEGSRCAARLLPLLARIGRHLPKTIN